MVTSGRLKSAHAYYRIKSQHFRTGQYERIKDHEHKKRQQENWRSLSEKEICFDQKAVCRAEINLPEEACRRTETESQAETDFRAKGISDRFRSGSRLSVHRIFVCFVLFYEALLSAHDHQRAGFFRPDGRGCGDIF